MAWQSYLVTVTAAYFIGSMPTGYLVGRAKGIDIRQVGSGNIGATNVFRALGKTAGIFVLLADAAKGVLACILGPWLAGLWSGAPSGPEAASPEGLAMAGGVAAILGHNYTCWLRFKGGKGIATSAGVFLTLAPLAFLILLALWGAVLGLTRYVSVASIAAAAGLPVAVWLTGGSPRMIGLSVALGLLAIYKHRGNVRRLREGTEHRLGRPARTQEVP